MFLFSLLLNFFILFIIINLNWLISKTRFSVVKPKPTPNLVLPLVLGIILTLLDSFRLTLFYNLLLWIIMLPFAYWLSRKIQQKFKR